MNTMSALANQNSSNGGLHDPLQAYTVRFLIFASNFKSLNHGHAFFQPNMLVEIGRQGTFLMRPYEMKRWPLTLHDYFRIARIAGYGANTRLCKHNTDRLFKDISTLWKIDSSTSLVYRMLNSLGIILSAITLDTS
jgi:hypothetical protein